MVLPIGEEAEKEFCKLRDRYARARKNLQEKNKSGTSTKAVQKAREKMRNLQFMAWLDEFIKPRKSKTNIKEAKVKPGRTEDIEDGSSSENEDTDPHVADGDKSHSEEDNGSSSSDEGGEKIDEGGEKVPIPNDKSSASSNTTGKRIRKKRNAKMSEVEKEEMDILKSISQAATSENVQELNTKKEKDSHDLFGEYVANKFRKLSEKLDESEMELMEYEIVTIFAKKYAKSSQQNNHQSWPNYQMGSFGIPNSNPYEYTNQNYNNN